MDPHTIKQWQDGVAFERERTVAPAGFPALPDPGALLCHLFLFDQTSTTTVEGPYLGVPTRSPGNCGSSVGGIPRTLNGTRLSGLSSGAGSLPSQQARGQAETEEAQAEKSEPEDEGSCGNR